MGLKEATILLFGGIACVFSTLINVDVGTNNDVPNTLQTAIDSAWPGDTIVLQSGQYFEDIQSVRDGKEGAPITIKGPASAVIRGDLGARIVLINHDHIHLEGFTIDGQGSEGGEDVEDHKRYHDHLIHVHGNRLRTTQYGSHTHRSSIVGFQAEDLSLVHAGSSCVKMSYFVTHSSLVNNNVSDCGRAQALCSDIDGCGAGLDLGTAVSRRMENIGAEIDESAWNVVGNNTISSVGGACIVLQEGVRSTLIDGNTCLDSDDVDGAGIYIRGDGNIIRQNKVRGGAGAGLGVGGAKLPFHRFGVYNQIYLNELESNDGGSLLNGELPKPSGMVCMNSVGKNSLEELDGDCPDHVSIKHIGRGDWTHQAPINSGIIPTSSPEAGNPEEYVCNEVPLTPEDVSSSETDADNPGNSAYFVLEDSPNTHWSRFGMGQWLEFNVQSAAGVPTIEAVEIQFFQGASRVQLFEMSADGEVVIHEGASKGTTDAPELFKFTEHLVSAKIIRITGQGNMPNDSKTFSQWNSITRVRFCQTTPSEGPA